MALNTPKRIVWGWLMQYASRLRFPKLLALSGLIFVLDLIVPDAIPFVDEILIGLITILLASLKKKKSDKTLTL
jgi:hypothetical protein